MIGYMGVREQVDSDFERARRRSFFGRLADRLRGKSRRAELRAFDEVRRYLHADNRRYLGRRVVELSEVVGSVGRHREFDGRYMPTRASAERWKRVDLAFLRGEELPPVSLYALDGRYYVHDGNHRVSVARYQGVEMIEAEVTEFLPARYETAAPERRLGCGPCAAACG